METSDEHDRKRFRMEPPRRVGPEAGIRLSGRRGRRARSGARAGQGEDGLRPGSARGDGRLHGIGACQVHRRGRALLCDLRTRRDPSADRALRRQDGPCAGGGDRRPAGPHRDRRALPAGGRPADAVQGRRQRIRRDGDGAGADPTLHRPRGAHRGDDAQRDLRHHSKRPAGACLQGSAAGPWHHAYRCGLRRSGEASGAVAAAAGCGRAECRQEGRDPGRFRCPRCDRRGDRGRREAAGGCREGAARQGGAAGLPALVHRRARAARDQAVLGPDAGMRHAADARLLLSV